MLNGDPVFVPVASDKSWFSPTDRNERDGHYYVASGDQEERYEDYWAALDFLSHATLPRWRYRDAGGRWRAKIGRGDDWLRNSRSEIEAVLNATSDAPVVGHQSKRRNSKH